MENTKHGKHSNINSLLISKKIYLYVCLFACHSTFPFRLDYIKSDQLSIFYDQFILVVGLGQNLSWSSHSKRTLFTNQDLCWIIYLYSKAKTNHPQTWKCCSRQGIIVARYISVNTVSGRSYIAQYTRGYFIAAKGVEGGNSFPRGFSTRSEVFEVAEI